MVSLPMRDRDPAYIIATYIMASRRNGTLYTGVSSNLAGRVWQHRAGTFKGFSARYGCKTLVWFEPYELIVDAIAREKQIKKWRRAWKLALIEAINPQRLDLAEPWFTDSLVIPGLAESENPGPR